MLTAQAAPHVPSLTASHTLSIMVKQAALLLSLTLWLARTGNETAS